MIIVLIFVGIIILGFVIYRFYKILYHKYGIWDDRPDLAKFVSDIFFVIGTGGLLICVIMILGKHVGVDNQIAKNQIRYEILCEKYKLIQSNYEDISKVEVLKEIAQWNIKVQDEKYWAESPWTNWFLNKQITDSLQYIDISEIN